MPGVMPGPDWYQIGDDLNFADVAGLRATTEYENKRRAGVQSPSPTVYMFDSAATLADNGDTVIKPTDIGAGDPGRWIKISASVAVDPDDVLDLTDQIADRFISHELNQAGHPIHVRDGALSATPPGSDHFEFSPFLVYDNDGNPVTSG